MAGHSLQMRMLKSIVREPLSTNAPEKSSNDIFPWEKELMECQQRRNKTIEAEAPTNSDSEARDSFVHDGDQIDGNQIQEQQLHDRNSTSQPPSSPLSPASEEITSTSVKPESEPIIFLPQGKSAMDNNIDGEGYKPVSEPVSSSHELVGRFCIFSQVIKFPYKFMQDPEGRVSHQFFSNEQVFKRNWNMHYMFGSNSYSSKPLMLVPLGQVQKLLAEIAQEFNLKVSIPNYPFQLSFYKDGTPIPTSIGTVNSKADMANVQSQIPASIPGNYGSLPNNPTDAQVQDHDAWVEKLEDALDAQKNKKGAKRRKTKERSRWLVREDLSSLHRAQRYLGLREKLSNAEAVQPNPSLEAQQPGKIHGDDSSAEILDLTQVVPFPFEDETVIISVDIESWESNHSLITEIGISTLDTADIKAIAPGTQGENWVKKIRSRHLRIKGTEQLYNFKYVEGNPHMFQFGTSEFVTLQKAPEVVDSCFEYPYSAGFECEGPPQTDDNGDLISRTSAIKEVDLASTPKTPRSLILVGHDISGDIDYLSSLGSEIFGTNPTSSSDDDPSRRQRVLSSFRELLDTAVFYKALNKDEQTRSLAKICADLDIQAWYPHNAGNDARYTLEAFVKMVIKSRRQDDGVDTITREIDSLEIGKEQPAEATTQVAKTVIVNKAITNETITTSGTGKTMSHPTPLCGPEIVTENSDAGSDGDSDTSSCDEMPY